MAYILKNTTGLINTRVTDTGRQKMSQGNFNIAYFQVGDSEICYNCLSGYNLINNNILEPCYDSQNSVGSPQSNKQYLKYPYYVDQVGGNFYGIPFNDARNEGVYNAAAMRGFFTGTTGSFTRQFSSAYTINSDFQVIISNLVGTTQITISSGSTCDVFTGSPSVGDFITIYFDGGASCNNVDENNLTLTFRITGVTPSGVDFIIDLDRPTPNFSSFGGLARCFIYPPAITSLYDTFTPSSHWYDDVIDFESVCGTDAFDVLVWNMNIPWTESPAGINNSTYMDYNDFGSKTYIGTKDYLGYNTVSGHTIVDGAGIQQPNSFYYNSVDERIEMTPDEQKSIAIVHYTNNTIDLFYGEKFATEPFDSTNISNTTGQARNFKISLPWLAWHKSQGLSNSGQTFWIDPDGFNIDLFEPFYIQSKINFEMNEPGIRYFNLWDTNPNSDGYPNSVGKVFPDQKIIVFDDEEIIATMSYKSNRSWTLPAPKLSLVTPNVCSGDSAVASVGIMSSDTEYMYVTYRLDNTITNQYALHCNYYPKIVGPSSGCSITPQNVAVKFGNEFPYMVSTSVTTGFAADSFKIICQKVTGNARPDPSSWVEIDYTSMLTTDPITGLIFPSGLTANTFVISEIEYNAGVTYDLGAYLQLTQQGDTGSTLNFGDEYYFYGVIETDIQATIYELRYLINLNQSEFQTSSNPTWTSGSDSYMTEIGLFDNDKDLVIISKFQSPVKRQGVQQIIVKFDF